jgi:hypothetical protein
MGAPSNFFHFRCTGVGIDIDHVEGLHIPVQMSSKAIEFFYKNVIESSSDEETVRQNSYSPLQAWRTTIICCQSLGWLVGEAQGQHRPASSWWTHTSYVRLFPPNRSVGRREEILSSLADIQEVVSRYS